MLIPVCVNPSQTCNGLICFHGWQEHRPVAFWWAAGRIGRAGHTREVANSAGDRSGSLAQLQVLHCGAPCVMGLVIAAQGCDGVA